MVTSYGHNYFVFPSQKQNREDSRNSAYHLLDHREKNAQKNAGVAD